jgi:hypothetical protein
MTWLLAIFARSALMQSPIGAFLKSIPRWAWIAIAAVAIVAASVIWHQHKAHAAIAAAEKRGEDRAYAHIAAKARAIEQRAAELGRKISAAIRSRTDEENRHIAARADAQRLRGPGASACSGYSRLPAAAGGPKSKPGLSDAARPRVPADDIAAVPWPWLVDRAEQCDLNLTEVTAWRSWYEQQSAAWEKLRAQK